MLQYVFTAVQVIALVGVCLLGNWLSQAMQLHFPGSIIGIFILLFLLKTRLIRLEWIERGADFLIKNLMLFFVPSAVGIMEYKQMVVTEGLRVELIILCGTFIVMLFTGKLTEYTSRLLRSKNN